MRRITDPAEYGYHDQVERDQRLEERRSRQRGYAQSLAASSQQDHAAAIDGSPTVLLSGTPGRRAELLRQIRKSRPAVGTAYYVHTACLLPGIGGLREGAVIEVSGRRDETLEQCCTPLEHEQNEQAGSMPLAITLLLAGARTTKWRPYRG